MFIHQVFEAQVEETPDSVALVFEGESLTYRELDNRANQLARRLKALGVGPEVPVGICMERSVELVVAILGLFKAGGAYLPLDPAQPKERLSFILNNTQPAVILAQKRLLAMLPSHDAHEICLDSDWSTIAEQSNEPLETMLNDGNLAFLIYTSGSTGEPKAVMLPHRQRENRVTHENTVHQMTRNDRHVLKSSISFTLVTREVFWPLLTGSQLFITPPGTEQDSAYLAKFIAQNKITIITLTPSMLGAFLEEPEAKNCPSLRHVVCFGEPLTPELQRRFFSRLSAELSLYYGATEAPSATLLKCRREDVPTTIQLGHPLPGKQMHLLDGGLQAAPLGVSGELHIGGKLARGYFKRPDLTAERFIPDPFSEEPGLRLYRTGDLGRYLPDGSIEFLGRVDDQVKIRGFRIELGEIEAALRRHKSIRQAVVTAREDRAGDSRLVAYVVLEQGNSVSNVRDFLRTKLPEYMLPSRFVFLDELPLTTNGKVDRRSLPAPDQTNTKLAKNFVAPRDELELQLVRIWENVLGAKPIGVKDNFFELGGHSLLAARLFGQIEKITGKHLPLAILFRAPTVEQIAGILRREQWSASWSSLVPIQPGGSKSPFFVVHAHEGNVLFYRDLARYLGADQPFYGLQAQGLDGKQAPYTRMEEMASHYIKEIRTLQPEGPYFLGGYCFGGLLAFEMAQQLRAAGAAVALVALIDAYAPGFFASSPNRTSIPAIVHRLRQKVEIHLSNLLMLGPKEKFRYIKARLMLIAYRFYTGIGLPSIRGRARSAILKAMSEAVRNYEPQVYPGRITLLRATKLPRGESGDPQLGWGKLAGGGLDVHLVPGYFMHTILEPSVRRVGKKLKACINQAHAAESYYPVKDTRRQPQLQPLSEEETELLLVEQENNTAKGA